ncbi:MAG: hypothetical protein A2297_03920 [Elusimicrobia bacterium RIFOXYB2_FULL_48_7]|nr:MAG: hypothetical protein A2297_03920 [Elusimicrobia bacterium RIFOXYB2_FULL_48_7]
MNKYLNQTLEKYLNDLASRLPAPGGGSAAALVASTGVSLLSMVANFTLDKKGYEKHQDEITKIIGILESKRKKLNELIDSDVEAYEKVSSAYKLPKNTPEEKQTRDLRVQEALKQAMSVPWEIAAIAAESMSVAEKLSAIGNKNLISDVSCGAFFLKSAIEAAGDNVTINLNSINDKDFSEQKQNKLSSMTKTALSQADIVLNAVKNMLTSKV